MRKTAQLERKGLWSLKIDDDNNPNDQYEKVVFFLFAPFFFFLSFCSILNQRTPCSLRKRRATGKKRFSKS